MARINLEDKLFNDGRFQSLEAKHGKIIALGVMVLAFKMAQTYWLKDKQLIPESEFLFNPIFQDLLNVGLAEKRDGGIYIRGSDEQFEWWFRGQEKCKKMNEKKKKKSIKTCTKSPASDLLDTSKRLDPHLDESPQSQSQSLNTFNNNVGKKFGDNEHLLVDKMCLLLKKNNPSIKLPISKNSWLSEADKLIRIDSREINHAMQLLEWSQEHHFWKQNILSMGKFREKYDMLTIQHKEATNGQGNNRPTSKVKHGFRPSETDWANQPTSF